jgi:mannose-6-phosphate isomerase-like protein (cupin superfamily)
MASSKKVLVIDLNENPEYQKLLDGQLQTSGMRAGRVYLQPGQNCGEHSTKDHEELLVFLSGQGQLLIEQTKRLPVGVGKVCYIPPNTIHDVNNNGAEPLIYIYCVAPVGDIIGRSQ